MMHLRTRDKIRLFFRPMYRTITSDGIIFYKIDKCNRYYIFSIELPPEEVLIKLRPEEGCSAKKNECFGV